MFFSIKSLRMVCLRKLFYLNGLLLAFQFSSCEREEVLTPEIQSQERLGTEIRVGEKVESPFLLRNMQRAVDSLSLRSGLKRQTVLEPTHLYVRFLPADSSEYEALLSDTLLDVTSYPLDYKLTEGDSYRDPSLPAEAITWQYSVVPARYDFGKIGVEYELLDKLYILDEDLDREDVFVESSLKSGSAERLVWRDVVNEALIQTGNLGENELRSKWTPCATIKAYDDLLKKYIPLQGVKVRIRYFAFLKAYHYTDANGNVSFDSKRTSVEYSIEWERDMWDIRDGGVQAYYNGPDQKSKWNLNIGSGTQKSLHYSAIHRALYKYYYGDCCGLKRPNKAVKISYQTGKDPDGTALGSTAAPIVRTWNWIFSAIRIYEKGSQGNVQEVSNLFATTLHELTHASHACRLSRSDYDDKVSKFIKESWAVAAEWYLVSDEYKKLGASGTEFEKFVGKKNIQSWPYIGRSLIYSSLFIDMVDTYNQGENNSSYPNDDISGYTMSLIDSKLTSMRTFVDVESFMKSNRPANVSFNQINNFLKIYKEKWTN